MLKKMAELASAFPAFPLGSKNADYLKRLCPEVQPEKYITLCFLFASLAAVLFLLFSGAEAIYSPILFGFVFLIFCWLPKVEYQKTCAEMEAELPLYLKNISVFLSMGLPFESAVGYASDSGKFGIGIKSTLLKGRSTQNALLDFSSNYESVPIKRAVSQLLAFYQHGAGAENISKLGDELLSIQRHKLKTASSRSAVLGLIYTVFSTIAPTFLLIYYYLSEAAFQTKIETQLIIYSILILIPGINFLIMIFALNYSPQTIFSKKSSFDFTAIGLAGIFAVSAVVLPDWLLPIAVLAVLPAAYLYSKYHSGESKTRKIEEKLPDALLALSTNPKGASPEKCFTGISSGYGELSGEISLSLNQLRNGVELEKVMDDFRKRNHSPLISCFCTFLLQSFNTSSIRLASSFADDILKFFEVLREKEELFSMQKYTLILASVLIPLVLALSGSTLHGAQDAPDEFPKIILGYLIIHSTLTSIFISNIEGKGRNSIYLVLLLGLSLITFYLSNNLIL